MIIISEQFVSRTDLMRLSAVGQASFTPEYNIEIEFHSVSSINRTQLLVRGDIIKDALTKLSWTTSYGSRPVMLIVTQEK